MACANILTSNNADYEREEGEIVDDLDDLSDISSEEEFLLRQRLQVLENYNNVLERKKAKGRIEREILSDLSDVSINDLHDTSFSQKLDKKEQKVLKIHRKPKKRNYANIKGKKETKKKSAHHKKKLKIKDIKIINETSEESDDEYRNKRRKLANAVALNKDKSDSSSLKDRLEKMLGGSQNLLSEDIICDKTENTNNKVDILLENSNADVCVEIVDKTKQDLPASNSIVYECIDLCSEEELKSSTISKELNVTEDSVNKQDDNVTCVIEENSDEDIELLRQNALQTKSSKTKIQKQLVKDSENKVGTVSDDEDSDTAELRLICLKSTLLKKAIEMKKKQKLRKRLSQSCSQQDKEYFEQELDHITSTIENNTDTESVDMEIGSDIDDKLKENLIENNQKPSAPKDEPNEDELDEDEDLLRAKLLTSLSKNLPNLVDPDLFNSSTEVMNNDKVVNVSKSQNNNISEQKRFIIKLGESDSEAEHEATTNLTKMHIKLSEQVDFQQKLDQFLKSTRLQVESSTLPDVVQKVSSLSLPKTPEKFIPKAVDHLPKSEQIEYKNLVKRMAELEKIKQARQLSVNVASKAVLNTKDTLKPKNGSVDSNIQVPINNNIDEQIAISRKKIADESSALFKLKEEALKLSQKYKIAATELRNISTAITLNKKQQKATQNRLHHIRRNHQMLVKRSSSKHSKPYDSKMYIDRPVSKLTNESRLQKENITNEEYKNQQMLKSVKVSVVNDLNEDINTYNHKLSVELDIANNKKIIKIPKILGKDRVVVQNENIAHTKLANDVQQSTPCQQTDPLTERMEIDEKKDELTQVEPKNNVINNINDYRSPLQGFDSVTWKEDPNAVLCPFEFGGNCRDPECQFLHPQIPTKQ